jgi:putative transposase
MFIESHPEYAAAKWARHLDVSLSGYYRWKDKKEQRQKEVDEYKKMIKTIFQKSKGTYGVDRICSELRKCGKTASYHRVKRLMDDMGLHSIHKRRRQRSLTDSRRACGDEYVNLVKDLEITEPFQVVSSDISYIRTMKGFEYLCTVKDIASGIVLAESMAEHMNSDLVLATIKKALNRWHLPAGTIFHSDRGSQYTSQKVMEYLSENHIWQSFSRVGKPGDNAWSESFFANLKKEAVHWRHFKTREEARQGIFAYIEGFYNTRRIQKRLDYLSPIQWLRRWEDEHLLVVA